VGQITGLKLTNSPVGYRPNNEYELTIGASPSADGKATAKFSVSSLGVISAQVQNAGFGYITKPTITAYVIFVATRDLLKMTAQPSHISAMNTGSPFNLRPLDTNTRIPLSVKFKHSSRE
jgi:hypothetical protein